MKVAQWTAVLRLRDGYWSEAGLSAIPSHVPVGSRMDHERGKWWKKNRHTVDVLVLAE